MSKIKKSWLNVQPVADVHCLTFEWSYLSSELGISGITPDSFSILKVGGMDCSVYNLLWLGGLLWFILVIVLLLSGLEPKEFMKYMRKKLDKTWLLYMVVFSFSL